jgi:hypothetical protein
MRRRSRPHRAIRTLIVVNGASGLRARAASTPLQGRTFSFLGSTCHCEVIPHLRDLRATVVQGSLARCGLVVSCTRAANVRRSAILGAQSFLKVGEGVGCAVGGNDVSIREPLVGVQAAVVEDDGLEEVDYLFVFGVLGTIAGDIEGGEACSVLRELVLSLCQL